MKNGEKDVGEKIQKATDDLIAKGFTKKAATYAAAMGYMRTTKNNK